MLWSLALAGTLLAYLAGSLAGGHIAGRLWHRVDVRRVGSGNAGTMNVLRNLGVMAGIATFLWDTAKGYLLATLGWKWGGIELAVAMALAAVAGHNWPLYWQFKGGKGLATSLGAALAIYAPVVPPAAIALGLLVFLSRNSDLATMVIFSYLPFYFWWRLGPGWYFVFGLGLAVIMLLRHGPLVIGKLD
ncbi:Glycerol-3-phosphate acyltransferase, PlsY [Moorella glycerini]|uniref:Glycerol-3-phosphate acyltransferase n=1 Tax=Neomoorella stamsii TaxID=1266720 RepID=A0A9X7P5B9_9FIRM|nr:glycerol-3-phosphate acyltransferase [Moorella stamsii]PRR71353.1 putative glycerol-3-phosphate acyltransferase [Moorella stamsii]CEP66599.1 Glycerol-3-phosphate acyltransferase, PlsY [Moorella glycerini]CEP68561.1 Glycerol-3-phosphate acyltransferase, PlsY [Moorella glycerini]